MSNPLRTALQSLQPLAHTPVFRHLVLVMGLLIASLAVGGSGFLYAQSHLERALGAVVPSERSAVCKTARPSSATGSQPTNGAEPRTVLLPSLDVYKASDEAKQRIRDQAIKAQRLECMHAELVSVYVANHYMAVFASVMFAAVAAVSLFLISRTGWAESNQYLNNLFLTSATIAALYGSFPSIFQHSAMVTAHKAQMLRYEMLLDGMASHIATPHLVPSACAELGAPLRPKVGEKEFPAVNFIACSDAALAALELPFALDPSKSPNYQTVFGAVQ